jgi:hypothetical protein
MPEFTSNPDSADIRHFIVEQPKKPESPPFSFDPRSDMAYFNWQEITNRPTPELNAVWHPSNIFLQNLFVLFPEMRAAFDLARDRGMLHRKICRELSDPSKWGTNLVKSIETAKRLFPDEIGRLPMPPTFWNQFADTNDELKANLQGTFSCYEYLNNLYNAKICYPGKFSELAPDPDTLAKVEQYIKKRTEQAIDPNSAGTKPRYAGELLFIKTTIPELYAKIKIPETVQSALLEELKDLYDRFMVGRRGDDTMIVYAGTLRQLAMGEIIVTDTAIRVEDWKPKTLVDEPAPGLPESRNF